MWVLNSIYKYEFKFFKLDYLENQILEIKIIYTNFLTLWYYKQYLVVKIQKITNTVGNERLIFMIYFIYIQVKVS